jgi:hypothetical protein
VRFVVFREDQFAIIMEFLANEFFHPDSFFDPEWDGFKERLNAGWNASQISMQDAVELEEGLFIKRDMIHLFNAQASFPKAISDRVFGKRGIVFLAGKAFFLRGGDDFAVSHQAGRAVMVERGNPQDVASLRTGPIAGISN